jgi:hypothetical protein
MIKRYSASHCPKCARHEDDYNIKPLELFETPKGQYVLYSSHQVTVTLYNKTLKNYMDTKTENKELREENAELLKRIAELEASK